jgi:putative sulfotransferase
MLAAHPDLLNLSELFAALQPDAFPPGKLAGAEFWRLLSEPTPAWSVVVAHGLEPPEFLYPIDRGGRFDRTTGVAPVAAICLPSVTNDPDALYDDLGAVVPTFPTSCIGEHYKRLFGWLADRLARPAWFERSGGSLRYCGQIVSQFGEGRFVHLYGDGYETAVSMSRHPFFRMAIVREMLTAALGFDPYARGVPFAPATAVPRELSRLLPQTFHARALHDVRIPLDRFGRRWSAEILHGTAQLGALPRGSVHHISLQSFLGQPERSLRRLFEFLEIAQPASPTMAEMLLRARRRTRDPVRLSPAESRALSRACEPGEARMRVLAASS